MLIVFLATFLVFNVAQGKIQESNCDGIKAKKQGIITTASCVKGLQLSNVHIQTNEGRSEVIEVIRHPKYQNSTTSNHDIAILRLANPIPSSGPRLKAKVGRKLPSDKTSAYIRGCKGQIIPVKILSEKSCNKQKGGEKPEDLVCAFATEKTVGKMDCSPMRGAPLIAGRNLIGIYTKSNKPKKPLDKDGRVFLHTSVIVHRKWIKKVLKDIVSQAKKNTPCPKAHSPSAALHPQANEGQLSLRRSFMEEPIPGPTARETLEGERSFISKFPGALPLPIPDASATLQTVNLEKMMETEVTTAKNDMEQTRRFLGIATTETSADPVPEKIEGTRRFLDQTTEKEMVTDSTMAQETPTNKSLELENTRRSMGLTTPVDQDSDESSSDEDLDDSSSENDEEVESVRQAGKKTTPTTSQRKASSPLKYNETKKITTSKTEPVTFGHFDNTERRTTSRMYSTKPSSRRTTTTTEATDNDDSDEYVDSESTELSSEEEDEKGVVVVAQNSRVPFMDFSDDDDILLKKFQTRKLRDSDGTVVVRLPKGNRGGAFVVFGRRSRG